MFNTDAILYFKRRNNTPSHKTAFSHSNFFFAVLNPHIFISSAQRLYLPPPPKPLPHSVYQDPKTHIIP